MTTGVFCEVPEQNCFDGADCVLDEECLPGAVYVYGDDIVPSEYGPGSGLPLVPNDYSVTAECGTAEPIPSASIVMWRWADTLLEGWDTIGPPEYPNYPAGSWGPPETARVFPHRDATGGRPIGWREL